VSLLLIIINYPFALLLECCAVTKVQSFVNSAAATLMTVAAVRATGEGGNALTTVLPISAAPLHSCSFEKYVAL
jgi:hypothetical protein